MKVSEHLLTKKNTHVSQRRYYAKSNKTKHYYNNESYLVYLFEAFRLIKHYFLHCSARLLVK